VTAENDNSYCTGNTNVAVKTHGKETLEEERKALSGSRIIDIEGVDVTRWARLFQVYTGSSTGKAVWLGIGGTCLLV